MRADATLFRCYASATADITTLRLETTTLSFSRLYTIITPRRDISLHYYFYRRRYAPLSLMSYMMLRAIRDTALRHRFNYATMPCYLRAYAAVL